MGVWKEVEEEPEVGRSTGSWLWCVVVRERCQAVILGCLAIEDQR